MFFYNKLHVEVDLTKFIVLFIHTLSIFIQVDLKRVEFRLYLETTGVMDALSYALIKLYDEIPKPTDPVAFVRQHFKLPTDTHKDTECAQLDGDFDGKRLIDKQQHELDLARQEIAKLRETLNVMANDSYV